MSGMMMAAAIERTVGIETIPHLTPRDSTIMGLESLLLGAHAEGVRNILAVTGDPPEVGDYPGSQGVYELDSIGLTSLLSRLNAGEDYNGKTKVTVYVVVLRATEAATFALAGMEAGWSQSLDKLGDLVAQIR